MADVVEAMGSHRPYRQAVARVAIIDEIEQGSGTLYDSDVARACLRVLSERDAMPH